MDEDDDLEAWIAKRREPPKTVEEKIVRHALNGSERALREALALMAQPYDGVVLRKLARERRVTGRVLKTVFVAEKLFSGEIDKDSAGVELRRFAIRED